MKASDLPPHFAGPLGASVTRQGVHFALASRHAERVRVCWFDAHGAPLGESDLQRHTDDIWRHTEPDLPPGTLYGFRVHGPWAPLEGHRFNPAKLLLDPYAREVVGRYDGDDIHLGHRPDAPDLPDPRDNATTALKARVLADVAQAPTLARPIAAAERVMYEVQLKAFTALHPDIPTDQRGRYAGLGHSAAVAHLKRLGITTVCLMPLAFRADEPRLLQQGLTNHWGYNTIAWSAPESRYASRSDLAREECRAMVAALHAAGLEVVLDVVFNHSAESDEWGPTLSLRGIDNRLYYIGLPGAPERYTNWAGCGNVLNINEPLVLRLVMDSLRRWVTDYGFDGFRFDLAPILGRGAAPDHAFTAQHPFFMAIAQDPVLRDRLMIAEPWDIGPGGYQLGRFPKGWLEWNDRFRDLQRGQWLHRFGTAADLAHALAGSAQQFPGRPAHSSVNLITAHDGFTLMDLVSHDRRHNHANGEDNRDGHGHNLSHNQGVEGPSEDPAVRQRRQTKRRALLANTLLSLGTPLLLAGDELGHSQQGNNNAYCQDNATTWIDWANADQGLVDFVAQLVSLRHQLATCFGSAWWRTASDDPPHNASATASWSKANGEALSEADWHRAPTPVLQLHLATPSIEALLIFNPGTEPQSVQWPEGPWRWVLDTGAPTDPPPAPSGDQIMPASTVWVLMR